MNTFLFYLLEFNGCISFSAYASLLGIPIGFISSAIRLKICAIAATIKKYKLIIKKKKKKHNKTVPLAKSYLYNIGVLIFKTLIDSSISHEPILINNVLKEYDGIKEEIKNLKI